MTFEDLSDFSEEDDEDYKSPTHELEEEILEERKDLVFDD